MVKVESLRFGVQASGLGFRIRVPGSVFSSFRVWSFVTVGGGDRIHPEKVCSG